MKWRDLDKTKYFVLSFGASFLSLLMLALCMASFVRSEAPQPSAADETPADAYYTPRAQDSMNVLLIVTENDKTPVSFILTRLDATRGEIPSAVFPPAMSVAYSASASTLAEVYAKDGAIAAKQALGGALGVNVEKYISFTRDSLIKAVDTIGAVEYELKLPAQYSAAPGALALSSGRQLLDGARFYEVLKYSSGELPGAEAGATAVLISEYINTHLVTILQPESDDIFRKVINLSESDISFEDYDSRREALTFLAKLSGRHSRAVSSSSKEVLLGIYG